MSSRPRSRMITPDLRQLFRARSCHWRLRARRSLACLNPIRSICGAARPSMTRTLDWSCGSCVGVQRLPGRRDRQPRMVNTAPLSSCGWPPDRAVMALYKTWDDFQPEPVPCRRAHGRLSVRIELSHTVFQFAGGPARTSSIIAAGYRSLSRNTLKGVSWYRPAAYFAALSRQV